MKVFDLSFLNLSLPYEKLYYVGGWSEKRKVAIVGTRSATLEYCKFTFNLAKQLALAGLNIVSGFAYGIDIYAHLGCLDSRVPGSITAILAVPLDKISPKEHTKYVKDILELDGFIGTVNKGDKEVFRNDFVLRNSVIAAISELVVFFESAKKNWAIHTVWFSLEYGKEVGVVPRAPWGVRNEGTKI
ncbi:MAG: DNA-protecting protein DprA, partial [Deltaproteobacteria bacterium]|nr:DNA-protecting protein DprA [Deltaproteobacteria bacterium]